jgi:hypothetical protein
LIYGESGVGTSSLLDALRFFFFSFFFETLPPFGELSVLEIPEFRNAATCAGGASSA